MDVMTTYLTGGEWHLRVDFGAGGGADLVLTGVSPVTGAIGIGAFDIEGDGTSELFAKVDAGAYTTLVGLYDVAACDLVPLTIGGGASAIFPVGASVGNFAGMTCDGTMLWTFSGTLMEGTSNYEAMDIPYTLSGHVLTQGTGDGAIVGADELPPLFSCGTLELP